jgi:hypothetical protein
MISTGRGGNIWPPMGVVLGALRHARVQGAKVYLFGNDSGWHMASALDEVPAGSAVWEFPANRNEPPQDWAGR